jgi:hypothetical protein
MTATPVDSALGFDGCRGNDERSRANANKLRRGMGSLPDDGNAGRQTRSDAMNLFKTSVACTLTGALIAAVQIAPAAAAPMPTNVATMKAMVPDSATKVYWRGGWGWGLGAGVLAGALIGGAVASSAYGYYGSPYYGGYYQPYPYYARPAYYGYGPYYGRPYHGGYYRPYRVYPRYRWGARW